MIIQRFFLDTEFNDEIGDCRIEPISIALVSEDGTREYYATSNDFDEEAAHPWLKANVLPKLPPYGQRIPLRAMREGIQAYFAQFAPQPGTDARLQIWGKNIGCDMVVMGLIFGGLSKYYETVGEIGFRRSFFNDTDALRNRLSEKGITPPRSELSESQRHSAIVDARQERLEYITLQNLLAEKGL